jgi:arylsulfate sulfotransferase
MRDPSASSRSAHARSLRRPFPILLFAAAAAGVSLPVEAAMTVSLASSLPGPVPAGTMVRWTATAAGGSDDLWYRFRLRDPEGAFRTIRDFGPITTLDWTSLDEGAYELEVAVRDRSSQEIATSVSDISVVRRVEGRPAVFATSQPLVYLFSSPGCEVGRARVRFESSGGVVGLTPSRPCVSGQSLNYYLAGLSRNTIYRANLVVENGRSVTSGPTVPFATGDFSFPVAVSTGSARETTDPGKILLQSPLFYPPFATDLDGRLLWVGPSDLALLTRPEPGGTFFGIAEGRTEPAKSVIRKFDLVGMTLQETNAARVSEQLVAMGKRPITAFHHEVRTLPDGRIATLGSVEQILTDVQGPGPLDVIGDMIVVLDADLQVVWAWDAFDHLDASRVALFQERCLNSPGCPPYHLAKDANDWTHSNSVAETPDGALLLSVRHQDWILKIDYAGGTGGGDVIWRLGKDGDFVLDSTDPNPWFSHQHDASFLPGSGTAISLFDNSNARLLGSPQATSRGQVLELDEANRIARLVLNAELGVRSFALGSAEMLSSGSFHFEAGLVVDADSPSGFVSHAFEVLPSGEVSSQTEVKEAVYRSFRLTNLYGEEAPPPLPERPETRVVAPRD